MLAHGIKIMNAWGDGDWLLFISLVALVLGALALARSFSKEREKRNA